MLVTNMNSARGNAVPNQFVIENVAIEIDGILIQGTVFQSYKTVIALYTVDNVLYLDEKYWDYSKTTMRYLNAFLQEHTFHKSAAKQIVEDNRCILADLNAKNTYAGK